MMDLNTGTPYETVTLTMFGRNRKIFFDIIKEGLRHLFIIVVMSMYPNSSTNGN